MRDDKRAGGIRTTVAGSGEADVGGGGDKGGEVERKAPTDLRAQDEQRYRGRDLASATLILAQRPCVHP